MCLHDLEAASILPGITLQEETQNQQENKNRFGTSPAILLPETPPGWTTGCDVPTADDRPQVHV